MQEDVTPAQMLAAEIEGTGESFYVGSTCVITVRMPIHMAADLRALAKKSGKTRNAMVVSLLDVGFSEVRKHLNEETLQELQGLNAEAFQETLKEAE